MRLAISIYQRRLLFCSRRLSIFNPSNVHLRTHASLNRRFSIANALHSWREIGSYNSLLAYTGWDAKPPQFLWEVFSPSSLELAASFWWTEIVHDHPQLALYSPLVSSDRDFKIKLYLKQPLRHLKDTKLLPPDLIRMLDRATNASHMLQHKEQMNAFFSAEEKPFGAKTTTTSSELLMHINSCYSLWCKNNRQYLAPYTSVVGPSGVGKSFAVKQLASRHGQYVIYISFGKIGGLGIPPRSRVADAYGNIQSHDRLEMEAIWERGLTIQLLLAHCADCMGISARQFWLLQTDGRFLDFQDRMFDLVSQHTSRQSLDFDQRSVEAECRSILAATACDLLSDHVPTENLSTENPSTHKPYTRFIIAIDEARGLLTGPDNIPFRALRTSLFKLSSKFPIFALFLDTTSQVANFSPPSSHDPSQKVFAKDQCKELFPVFYKFSYEIFSPRKTDLQNPDVSPGTVLRCGHAMFGAFLDAGLSVPQLLDIVSQKIDPCRPIAQDYNFSLSEVRYLAQLMHIISLDVVHYRFSRKLVSGWMHPLCGITHDREKLLLGPPKSPALALCALEHLCSNGTLALALRDFTDKLGSGHVDIGNAGEFVAALGLVLSTKMSRGLEGMVPMPLCNFVSRFFNEKVSSELLARASSSPQHHWMKHGAIFFNRVVRFHSASRRYPTVDDLLYFYSTGCIGFLPSGATGADIFIPVWISGSNGSLARMGCVLVQVKNRKNDSLRQSVQDSACDSIIKAANTMNFAPETPILGVMTCLRHRSNSGSVVVDADGNILVCVGVGLSPDVFSFLQEQPTEVRDALTDLVSISTSSQILDTDYGRFVSETSAENWNPEYPYTTS